MLLGHRKESSMAELITEKGTIYKPETKWTPMAAIFAVAVILLICLLFIPVLLNSSCFGLGTIFGFGIADRTVCDAVNPSIVKLIQSCAIIALVWKVAGIGGGRPVDVLLLHFEKGGIARDIRWASLILVFAFPLAFLWKEVGSSIWGAGNFARNPNQPHLYVAIVDFITLTTVGPVAEEFLFRGFLLSALAKSRLGFWPSAMFSTIAWALLHFHQPWYALVSTIIFGLMVSFAIWRTGSLWTCIMTHCLYNVYPAIFQLAASIMVLYLKST